jgi:cytoskeletal protein CcmA (bactofilin family)
MTNSFTVRSLLLALLCGPVMVGERVSGDVMAAGGSVSVRARVEDDVRLAGGDVMLESVVTGDAIAAGGNVLLTSGARVGGRAWLSGGLVEVAGTIGKELKAAGGRIVLSGKVSGDVELAGRTISILDSAIIDGNLVYRSPEQAEIASEAQIGGTVSYEPMERPVAPMVAFVVGVGIVVLLSLIVTGIAMFLLFPRFIGSALSAIRAEPWKCLGLGLAVFAATPVVIFVLSFTVIGWLPAVVIGALYLILLLAGFLTGAFYVGDLGAGLAKRGEVSRVRRLLSFVAALIVMVLLGLIPLLGTLLLFALMLLGVGVLNLNLFRAYVGRSSS